MKPLPETVSEFIAHNHVVSLATQDADGLWSACCFYAFVPEAAELVILTGTETRHGAAMLASPQISGTISGQPTNLRDIRGVQFVARAVRLESFARHDALRRYTGRHPLARLKTTQVWSLRLMCVKFTDNYSLFGFKTHWQRDEEAAA